MTTISEMPRPSAIESLNAKITRLKSGQPDEDDLAQAGFLADSGLNREQVLRLFATGLRGNHYQFADIEAQWSWELSWEGREFSDRLDSYLDHLLKEQTNSAASQ